MTSLVPLSLLRTASVAPRIQVSQDACLEAPSLVLSPKNTPRRPFFRVYFRPLSHTGGAFSVVSNFRKKGTLMIRVLPRLDRMAKVLAAFVAMTGLFTLPTASAAETHPVVSDDGIWQATDESTLASSPGERWIVPNVYRTLTLDPSALRVVLDRAPLEFTAAAEANAVVMTLPMPDGSFAHFRIYDSPIMEAPLAQKFPELHTYSGQGLDDPTATVRFDQTPQGFHAMILSASGTVFIDPYSRADVAHYISYNKSDYVRSAPMPPCLTPDAFDTPNPASAGSGSSGQTPGGMSTDGGSTGPGRALPGTRTSPLTPVGPTLRTYRLAVAADGEYTTFHGGTVANGLSAVMTSVNRVTGVYERELAVRLTLVANENLIIYTNSATDPYTDSSPSTLLSQNQSNLDSVIGSANYDIGHVFGTGGGGLSSLGVVCVGGSKARSETGSPTPIGDGYDIDYVAHEMGHEFNGLHTFNGSTGSCGGGNRSASAAYEVGSGNTIMAYAGICGGEDLQPHSDDYFHAKSFEQIVAFVSAGTGSTCFTGVGTGNNAPIIDAGPNFTIPILTPFVLTASASDPNGDPVTYDWEEYDLGTQGPPNTDDGSRPIFRSFNPVTSPSRTFPKLSDIINNTSTFGESLPLTSRTMTFRSTARDNRVNGGGVDVDFMTVTTTSTAGPFAVTAPNTAVSWSANSTRTVTWNVANTSSVPISTANVKISLSTDGGNTFPTVLAALTPNDGSENITVPNTPTSTARVKVEAVGNIFFDMSNVNFTITPDTGTPVIGLNNVTTTPFGSDGDAFVEPGESAKIAISLINNGTVGATAVSAVLSSSTPGVTVVTTQAVGYPNLPPSGTGSGASPYTFSLASTATCGGNLNFTLTVTYSGGGSPAVLPFTVPTGGPSSSTFNYAGPVLTIPDNNATGVSGTLTVSGFSGNLTDVDFKIGGTSCNATIGSTTVGVDHSWVGDLSMTLRSPASTTVTMMSRPGGVNNQGVNFCNTTLDDAGVSGPIQSIAAGGNPYSTSYTPASPLSTFNGQNPNGIWTLTVVDNAGLDTGHVRQWSLTLGGVGCNAPLATPGAVPETSLLASKAGGSATLSWASSCSASAADYAIYQGTIGSWYNHSMKFCTTQGLLTKTFSMDAGNLYWLVVPLGADREGSYGKRTGGIEIPGGLAQCKPQLVGGCP